MSCVRYNTVAAALAVALLAGCAATPWPAALSRSDYEAAVRRQSVADIEPGDAYLHVVGLRSDERTVAVDVLLQAHPQELRSAMFWIQRWRFEDTAPFRLLKDGTAVDLYAWPSGQSCKSVAISPTLRLSDTQALVTVLRVSDQPLSPGQYQLQLEPSLASDLTAETERWSQPPITWHIDVHDYSFALRTDS